MADGDATADEGADGGEEPRGRVGNFRRVGAVGGNLGETVEHLDAGDLDVVEPQPAVVHAVHAELLAVVLDADAWQRVAQVVADGDHEGVDAVALAGRFQLGENGGDLAVDGGVADVVLAGGKRRRMEVEGLRGRVVGGGCFQAGDVRAVADLGHGEAAREVEAGGGGKVSLVVIIRAQA